MSSRRYSECRSPHAVLWLNAFGAFHDTLAFKICLRSLEYQSVSRHPDCGIFTASADKTNICLLETRVLICRFAHRELREQNDILAAQNARFKSDKRLSTVLDVQRATAAADAHRLVADLADLSAKHDANVAKMNHYRTFF